MAPFPPLRGSAKLALKLGPLGALTSIKTLLTPADTLLRSRFAGTGARLLVAGNATHADIPLSSPGSSLMGLLMSMLGQSIGFPAPVGGASELTAAMARRFESLGGEIRCESEVAGIEVVNSRAWGVRTESYGVIHARHAVLAAVAAPQLYGALVASRHLPGRTSTAMRSFALDPGTVKVDWALSAPVPWASPPEFGPGTVHIADSLEEISTAQSQLGAGAVPEHPFLIVGAMTTTDASRSPSGIESLWAYSHVPQTTISDAGQQGITGAWDHSDCERFADRMQQRIEVLAPGFDSLVLARRVLGPRELESMDTSLVGGSINGGTAQLHQQAFLRPTPGLGRGETLIKGL